MWKNDFFYSELSSMHQRLPRMQKLAYLQWKVDMIGTTYFKSVINNHRVHSLPYYLF